ncbi:MAG: polysaccharide biosynthesis/export family protein [Maioricimonas sp. JB049]
MATPRNSQPRGLCTHRALQWAPRSIILASVTLLVLTGCSSTSLHTQAIPAKRVPVEFLGRPREAMQQISISRLAQDPPAVYQLAPGDVLGIYIQNVLGSEEDAPPVHFPERGDQAPALGFPVPIREDGTVALPYVRPIPLTGLTLTQAAEAIRTTYVEEEVLRAGQSKIIVTLMRPRKYRVTVIREEGGGREGMTKRGSGETVELPAYENDVLHALNETGGLPGLDARNEIYVIRGSFEDGAERDRMIAMIRSCRVPCQCPPEIPEHPGVTRIPIRFYPDEVPDFTEKDIILHSGDIVYIPARDTDKFYTGGVLAGGEFLLPRDYDIDVLKAIALTGGPVGSGGTGIMNAGGQGSSRSFGNRGASGAGANPSDLIVVRELPCGGQLPIRVDLNKAIVDESERILVQPGDMLILRYTLSEELYNALLGMLQFNFLYGLGGSGI